MKSYFLLIFNLLIFSISRSQNQWISQPHSKNIATAHQFIGIYQSSVYSESENNSRYKPNIQISYLNKYRINSLAEKSFALRFNQTLFTPSFFITHFGNENFQQTKLSFLINAKLNPNYGIGVGVEVDKNFIRYGNEINQYNILPKLGVFYKIKDQFNIGISVLKNSTKLTENYYRLNSYFGYHNDDYSLTIYTTNQLNQSSFLLLAEYHVNNDFNILFNFSSGLIPLGAGVIFKYNELSFRLNFNYHLKLGVTDYLQIGYYDE